MSSVHLQRSAPSDVPTPASGYDAQFIADGTEGTIDGGLYLKDDAGVTSLLGGSIPYDDEQAQDTIGGILVDTATIDLVYTDATPSITAGIVAGSVGATQLANDGVTNAKLANVATATIKGRGTAGTGDPEDLSVAQTKTLLAIVPADVTGFDTQVRTNRLDQLAAPTAPVALGSQKITGLADGTLSTDASTKGQLDTAIAGVGGSSVEERIQGRAVGAGTGTPTALTAAQVKAILAYTATGIPFTPAGGLSSTNTQAAIEETAALIVGGGYTDELAQDAIGTILVDSSTIDFTYTDATPAITAIVKTGSIGTTHLDFDPATQAELDAGITANAQSGTTYTLVLTDAFKAVECSNASAITLTVPLNSSVAFPVGTVLEIYQGLAGQVTVSGAGGVTIRAYNGSKTAGQYATVGLRKKATDEWVLTGGVA